MRARMKAASFAADIKDRLGVEAEILPAGIGVFDVIVDGEPIAKRGGNWLTRPLGAGWPDFEALLAELEQRKNAGPAAG